MEKKYVIGILTLFSIGLLGLGFASAFPMGFRGQELSEEQKLEMQERRQEMKNAIENGNFKEWKSLMEKRIEEMKAGLTEENFQKITERHQERMEMREACENGEEECGLRGSRMRGRYFFGNIPEE